MTHEEQILETLKEIRDGQRQVIELMTSQMKRTEERLKEADKTMVESMAIQRRAVQNARLVTFVAIPCILAAIAALAYLMFPFF